MASQRFRIGARQPMVGGSVILLAIVLAACGSSNVVPTQNASAAVAVASPSAGADASPSPSTSPSPTASATASPTATPSPTPSPTPVPPVALTHCTGKTGGTSGSVHLSTQTDFAGYLDYNGTSTVSCVEGSWVQPAVTCSTAKSDVVIYVGIGGTDGKGTSKAHLRGEKAASEAYCSGGTAYYVAWTNVETKTGYHIAPFTISPNDHLWAQVRASGSAYKLTVADTTTNQIYTSSATLKSFTRRDAEWTVQAVEKVALAKFKPFKFTGAEASIGGALRTVDRWQKQITTMGSGSLRRVTVSNLGNGTFTETWRHK